MGVIRALPPGSDLPGCAGLGGLRLQSLQGQITQSSDFARLRVLEPRPQGYDRERVQGSRDMSLEIKGPRQFRYGSGKEDVLASG